MDDNFTSFKDKIVDFGFKSGAFTPAGEKEAINYTQLVVKANVDGDIEEFVLSGQNPIKPKVLRSVLKGAETQKSKKQYSILDDED